MVLKMMESVSINTLTFDGQIAGYRVVLTTKEGKIEYYDLNVVVAEKYGLASGMYGIEVPLINYDGLLLSKKEKSEGITVKDISTNVEFLKRISAIKNKKENIKRVSVSAEEERKRAYQMDRYNRLLKICLNMLTATPYYGKFGGYSVVSVNLTSEIDRVLVSQGVFTTTKSLNKALKKGVIEYLNSIGYTYTSVSEYKKRGKEIKLVESVLSKYNIEDVFWRRG